MGWKTISQETLVDDYHVSVVKSVVWLPDGVVIDDFYTVTIPDAAMIAAITIDGKILLKNEFRYSIGSDVIECPAGMFEKNETDPLIVAGMSFLKKPDMSPMTGRIWERRLKAQVSTQTGCTYSWRRMLSRRAHNSLIKTNICQ